MSSIKGKIALISVLLSTIFITTAYADEQVAVSGDTKEQKLLTGKTFPETLQDLMDAPGRKSEIVIPMSKNEYEDNILYEMNKGYSKQKEKIEASFINVSYVDNLALVKFNTQVKNTYISVRDNSTGFGFSYEFNNGYLLSTTLYKFLNSDDKNISENLDYLSNRFENYLLKKGFVKKTSLLDPLYNIFSRSKEYTLGNYIVIISTQNDFIDTSFSVTMKNKEIEDNLTEITKDNKQANLEYEYKSLDKILK
jgi:hypothetical protein